MGSNADFSAHVERHISGVKGAAEMIDELLAKNPTDKFVFNRALMETLSKVLHGDSKLIKQLFEENQYIIGRVEKAMEKNHSKGYTITNTER